MAPATIKDPSNLGNVLLDLGVVTMEDLAKAVVQQMHAKGETHLGEVLQHMGAITAVDLAAALRVQTCLRNRDLIGAHMAVLDFQTKRIERSVDRSDVQVDAGLAAMDRQCDGCPKGLPSCELCPRNPNH